MNILEETRTSYSLQLITIGLLPFIMVLGNSLFIPIIPLIQTAMNVTPVQSGMMLTMFTIPAAIMIPFIGILSDRFGRKKMILLSLGVLIIGTVISSFATFFSHKFVWEIILFGRVLQGMGAGGTTLGMAMIGDLFTGNRLSQGLGILEVFNGFAKVVSPIIGGFIAMYVWYYSFYVLLVITIIALLAVTFIIKDRKENLSKNSFQQYLRKMSNVLKREFKWFIPIFLCSGVGMFTLFGTLFFLSIELEAIYGVEGIQKGMFLALPLCGLTISSYITGKKVGVLRQQLKRFMMFGLFLFFLAFSFLIFFHDFMSLLIFATFGATGLGLFLPAASTAITTRVRTAERGSIVAFYNTVRFLGVAFGPIFFGAWMYDLMELFFKTTFLIGMSSVILMLSWNSIPPFEKCPT